MMSLAQRGIKPHRKVQAALAGPRIVADHREEVSRREVPTRREIWCGPVGRDREDELDLAHVGGEADTATHGTTIAELARCPKPLDMAPLG